jgi:hypothetical protein
MSSTHDITIRQGSTFALVLKYSYPHLVSKTITAITKTGQAVITAASHGIPLNWQVWVAGVAGMAKINHRPEDIQESLDPYYAYYVDADTMRLNLDTSRFSAYTSGGELLYHPPVDLTGYTARMHIREDIEDVTPVHTMTTEDGGITLGDAAGTITLAIPATDTAAFDFDRAVYDLEIVSDGAVTAVISGEISLLREVTR